MRDYTSKENVSSISLKKNAHVCVTVEVTPSVGKRLEYFRLKAGFSSHESLALAAGVSRRTVLLIENNGASPKIETLVAVLSACNTTPAEFFDSPFGKGLPEADQELHRMLQAILDAGGRRRDGIEINIEDIYEGVIRQMSEELSKKEKAKQREKPTGTLGKRK